jgi:hypothetical protein
MLTVHTVRVLQGRVEILPDACHTSFGITLGAVDRLSGSPVKSKAANDAIHGLFCYSVKKIVLIFVLVTSNPQNPGKNFETSIFEQNKNTFCLLFQNQNPFQKKFSNFNF